MKKLLIRLGNLTFILLLMLSTVKLTLAQTPTPVTPATPPGRSQEKATGGIIAKVGDVSLKMAFNAHGGSNIKGTVLYSNSFGTKFWGNVNLCYFQEDNEAVFAGSIWKGNVDEKYFLVEVQDNGEGNKKTAPDAVRVRLFADPPTCTLSGEFPGIVDKGNIQVH